MVIFFVWIFQIFALFDLVHDLGAIHSLHHLELFSEYELELMFMKPYAPNRCLYIKVAKLRTGVGSAEMSHLQNCCLKNI